MKGSWIFLVLVLAAGCATSFTPWRGGQVIQGRGGSVRTVKGVDIWENGEPDRPYVIVGVIDSATLPTSSILLGATLAAGSESDMVNAAKKNGGDAVILVSEQTTSGGYNAMVTPDYSGGGTVTIRERVGTISKVLVVKYVGADGQNTHWPQAAPAQPSAFDQAYQAGMIAIASKDFKAAIESFHNAVTLDGSSTLAWTGLGVAHDRSHDFSDAMYCYQVALNLNPTNPAALAGLADAYGQIGDTNKYIETLEKVRQISPVAAAAAAEFVKEQNAKK